MRKHANLNPNAMMRDIKMSMDDYMSSKPVYDPFHLLDCCLELDGAGAFVVAAADRAKDMPHKPVFISGAAQAKPACSDDLVQPSRHVRDRPDQGRAARLRDGRHEAVRHGRRDDLRLLQLRGAARAGGGGLLRPRRGRRFRQGRPHRARRQAADQHPRRAAVRGAHRRHQSRDRSRRTSCAATAARGRFPNAQRIAVTGWGDLGDGALAVLRS